MFPRHGFGAKSSFNRGDDFGGTETCRKNKTFVPRCAVLSYFVTGYVGGTAERKTRYSMAQKH